MHRTLFEFGPIAVRMYGVMLAIAFWLAIELSARLARKRGLDGNRIVDLGLVVLVSSVAGSRLLYVVTHLAEYQDNWVGVFRVWEGGLSFYGGLAAGVIFGIGYLRGKRLPVLPVTDVVAPQIALGIALARVGCFLNGCCFGKESSLPWACTFPPDSQAGWVMTGRALHPTQLYSVIGNLVLFFILRRLVFRVERAGVVFFSFLVGYGMWRFFIDFLRYSEEHMYAGFLGGALTWNQVGSLGVIATGTLLLLKSRGRGESL
jgi:phosphatidylglycerol:prolipoprotein diacylglycerol transferase